MQNVSEWKDNIQKDQTIYARDIRDNKEYTVARLADDKLWMTKNLAIENVTLTAEDSDVESNFVLPTRTTNPNSKNAYDSTELRIDLKYGGYYSWYAATAGEGTQSVSVGNTNVEHSICPKGWRLPTSQDFVDLDIALGGQGKYYSNPPSTLIQTYQNYPNNFLSGGYGDGGLVYGKTEGYVGNVGNINYWSATASNADNASCFDSYWPYAWDPRGSHPKYRLMPIRCIAR